ncbi:hypothetical protein DFH11DRAFT_1836003 [Phellopilus nigrolimitatus]|nr:hypothetical protein DFH11DRAFT_1836003 [Phellopilus nigrolimitatus]
MTHHASPRSVDLEQHPSRLCARPPALRALVPPPARRIHRRAPRAAANCEQRARARLRIPSATTAPTVQRSALPADSEYVLLYQHQPFVNGFSPQSLSLAPVSLNQDQIHAFKPTQRRYPVPEHIQQALLAQNGAILDEFLQNPLHPLVKSEERGTSSTLARPKNLTSAMASMGATRLQRLLVPPTMPAGLEVIAERNRFIDARIEQRIRELSATPATLGKESSTDDANKENDEVQQPRLVV